MPKPKGDLEALAVPKGGTRPPAASAKEASPTARVRTLSLRLTEPDYQRLRRHAFDADRSHQDVIEEALREYLARAKS